MKQSDSNTFQSALVTLANMDVSASKLNLMQLANDNGLTLEDIQTDISLIINKLVDNKNVVLAGFNYKELLVTNRLSQAISRHNKQVAWKAFRSFFDTDGETVKLLSKVSITNKGLVFRGDNNRPVRVSAFTTLDSEGGSLISFSVEKDKVLGTLNVTMGATKVEVMDMKVRYTEWVDSLTDVSITLSGQGNATTPDVTITGLLPDEALNALKVKVESQADEIELKNNQYSDLKAITTFEVEELQQKMLEMHSLLSKRHQAQFNDYINSMETTNLLKLQVA